MVGVPAQVLGAIVAMVVASLLPHGEAAALAATLPRVCVCMCGWNRVFVHEELSG